MSKKIVAILMVASILSGCHETTRSFGGSMTLELPKGQKLEEITWKDDAALWYLTRPMRDDYYRCGASSKKFDEDFEIWERRLPDCPLIDLSKYEGDCK